VFNQFKDPKVPGYTIEAIYDRSIAVGARARLIATALGLTTKESEEALLAGMLHDVGKLLVMTAFPDEFTRAVERMSKESPEPRWAESQMMGITDSYLGAYLLSVWGFAERVVEAVALHYRPSMTPYPTLSVLTAVHLAYASEWDERNARVAGNKSALDIDYATKLGIIDQYESIKGLAVGAQS
jgi:HD-like signal output (HDOD) protein